MEGACGVNRGKVKRRMCALCPAIINFPEGPSVPPPPPSHKVETALEMLLIFLSLDEGDAGLSSKVVGRLARSLCHKCVKLLISTSDCAMDFDLSRGLLISCLQPWSKRLGLKVGGLKGGGGGESTSTNDFIQDIFRTSGEAIELLTAMQCVASARELTTVSPSAPPPTQIHSEEGPREAMGAGGDDEVARGDAGSADQAGESAEQPQAPPPDTEVERGSGSSHTPAHEKQLEINNEASTPLGESDAALSGEKAVGDTEMSSVPSDSTQICVYPTPAPPRSNVENPGSGFDREGGGGGGPGERIFVQLATQQLETIGTRVVIAREPSVEGPPQPQSPPPQIGREEGSEQMQQEGRNAGTGQPDSMEGEEIGEERGGPPRQRSTGAEACGEGNTSTAPQEEEELNDGEGGSMWRGGNSASSSSSPPQENDSEDKSSDSSSPSQSEDAEDEVQVPTPTNYQAVRWDSGGGGSRDGPEQTSRLSLKRKMKETEDQEEGQRQAKRVQVSTPSRTVQPPPESIMSGTKPHKAEVNESIPSGSVQIFVNPLPPPPPPPMSPSVGENPGSGLEREGGAGGGPGGGAVATTNPQQCSYCNKTSVNPRLNQEHILSYHAFEHLKAKMPRWATEAQVDVAIDKMYNEENLICSTSKQRTLSCQLCGGTEIAAPSMRPHLLSKHLGQVISRMVGLQFHRPSDTGVHVAEVAAAQSRSRRRRGQQEPPFSETGLDEERRRWWCTHCGIAFKEDTLRLFHMESVHKQRSLPPRIIK